MSVAFGDFNADGRLDLAVANGNASTVSVLLNTGTPPAGSVSINGGVLWTTSSTVTIGNAVSGATEMRFRDQGGAWTAWEAYAPTRPWTLPGSDGSKTVQAQYCNADATLTCSASIGLDTTPPTITLPPGEQNLTLEITSPAGNVVDFHPTITDTVDPIPTLTITPASGSTFPLGTTTVTLTGTDAAGNTATKTTTVKVVDTRAPHLTTPDNITTEATMAGGAVVSFTPTATDTGDAHPTVTSVPASGSVFSLGTTVVTVTASDASGNRATGTLVVTVRDTTPPTLARPDDITAEATGSGGAHVSWANIVATDAVDGDITAVCTPASGSLFPLGETTVNVVAMDAHHNAYGTTFKVTVQDTTPPTITLPPGEQNLTLEITSPAGNVVDFHPTITDTVDPIPTLTITPASGSTFPLGTTTVTLTGTDAAGNTATKTTTVKVVDTRAPHLTTPDNITTEATMAGGAVVSFTPTATDTGDAHPTVTSVPASGSVFPLGTTVVTVTASDASGNRATGTLVVTVRDTTPPVLARPDDITAEATGSGGAHVSWANIVATDAVDGDITAVCTPASGSLFPLGETTVNVVAMDAHHNAYGTSFKVTVADTTAPHITVTSPAHGATYAVGESLTASWTATDSGTGIFTQQATLDGLPVTNGYTIPTTIARSHTLVVTATDNAGNTATTTVYFSVALAAPAETQVVARGIDDVGQCDVSGWTNIVQIAAAGPNTVGLKADGSVIAAGWDNFGVAQVSGWRNIAQVDASGYQTVGLKKDGTVVAIGYDGYGQSAATLWTNIAQVAVGGWHTVGLKADGTVVAAGMDQVGQCDVSGWSDIVQVDAGAYHTAGLKSDGTVVAVGTDGQGQCDVSGWSDIVQVACGTSHTVGLRADGTVVAIGDNDAGQCNVSGWSDIVQVAAGGYHTVGLRADGTVVAVGNDDYQQCEVSGWRHVVQITAGELTTVALRDAGTGSFAGKADFATGTGPQSVALADFNGDGKQDLVTANHDADTVSILVSDGFGDFGANSDFATGDGPSSVAVGDFNGDGAPDLVTANAERRHGQRAAGVRRRRHRLRRQDRLRHRRHADLRGRRRLQRRRPSRPGDIQRRSRHCQRAAGQWRRPFRRQDRLLHRQRAQVGGRRGLQPRRQPRSGDGEPRRRLGECPAGQRQRWLRRPNQLRHRRQPVLRGRRRRQRRRQARPRDRERQRQHGQRAGRQRARVFRRQDGHSHRPGALVGRPR